MNVRPWAVRSFGPVRPGATSTHEMPGSKSIRAQKQGALSPNPPRSVRLRMADSDPPLAFTVTDSTGTLPTIVGAGSLRVAMLMFQLVPELDIGHPATVFKENRSHLNRLSKL